MHQTTVKQDPVLRNRFIRVGEWLSCLNQLKSAKHPCSTSKILSTTGALVRYHHTMKDHLGISHGLAIIRRRLWIIHQGLQTSVWLEYDNNAGINWQLMNSLPDIRIQNIWFPFEFFSINHFGTLPVRQSCKTEKCYVCLSVS